MSTVQNDPTDQQRRGWPWQFRGGTASDRADRRYRHDMGYVRLRGELDAFREEFDSLVADAKAAGVSDTFWETDVRDLFDNVEDALNAGRVEDGWRQIHAARRIEVYGFEAIDEQKPERRALETKARVVRDEALGVLGDWRKQAVEGLLGKESLITGDQLTGDAVREASRILHEQYESIHLKRRYLQLQFRQLFWLGASAGVVFLVLSALPYFVADSFPLLGPLVAFLEPPFDLTTGAGSTADVNVLHAGFAVFVGLAGVIGASLFGMRSLRKQSLSTKIPQGITSIAVTGARGLIGAISALVFYFILQTPFMSVGGNSPAILIVVGFAAGYSERMVPEAVARVSSATKTDEETAERTEDSGS